MTIAAFMCIQPELDSDRDLGESLLSLAKNLTPVNYVLETMRQSASFSNDASLISGLFHTDCERDLERPCLCSESDFNHLCGLLA